MTRQAMENEQIAASLMMAVLFAIRLVIMVNACPTGTVAQPVKDGAGAVRFPSQETSATATVLYFLHAFASGRSGWFLWNNGQSNEVRASVRGRRRHSSSLQVNIPLVESYQYDFGGQNSDKTR
jgi:hypothetical protein